MRTFVARTLVLLGGLQLAPPPHLAAQPVADRHHVIILLDRSRSMTAGGAPREEALRQVIQERLARLCFTPGLLLETGDRALLDPERGDVLSIVGFGLDFQTASSFDGFITAPEPWGALLRAKASASDLSTLWTQIQGMGLPAFFSEPWSGISLAMPLALDHQGRHGGGQAPPVTRTFLLVVTDGEFNGGDPSLELGQLRDDLRVLRPGSPLLAAQPAVRERVGQAQSYYLFVPLGFNEQRGGVYLNAFEAVPNARTFGIESVWSFEHVVRFRRVPGGFRSEFRLSPVNEGSVRALRMEAILRRGDSVLQRQESGDGVARPVVRFTLPQTAATDDSLTVQLRFWVRQTDEVYGMQILSPDGSDVQGSRGLTRTLPVELERSARVLGLIPLPFWAYRIAHALGAGSQAAAAWAWNVALLLLFAGVLYFWIRKASTARDPDELENRITWEGEPSTRSHS